MHTLDLLPSAINFKCAGCGKRQGASAMRRQLGKCRKCGGDRWVIEALYLAAKTPFLESISTTWSFALGGADWLAATDVTPVVAFDDVTADEALEICQAGANFFEMARGYLRLRADFARDADHEAIRRAGGKNCLTCGALFRPNVHKPWHGMGYCGRICYARANPGLEIAEDGDAPEDGEPPPSRGAAKDSPIEVHCGCGFTFTTPALYAGTQRKCPRCGRKAMAQAPRG